MAPEGYDVFLSHSSADGVAVEEIAVRLRDEANLRPFPDKWALIPGEPWMPALERAIEHSTTVAVFFGPQGRGAWQDQERQLALVLAAEEHGKRVIPVFLPGARKEDVGGFMRLRTWVELGHADGFERLVAGVIGRAPGERVGALSGSTVPPSQVPSSAETRTFVIEPEAPATDSTRDARNRTFSGAWAANPALLTHLGDMSGESWVDQALPCRAFQSSG